MQGVKRVQISTSGFGNVGLSGMTPDVRRRTEWCVADRALCFERLHGTRVRARYF